MDNKKSPGAARFPVNCFYSYLAWYATIKTTEGNKNLMGGLPIRPQDFTLCCRNWPHFLCQELWGCLSLRTQHGDWRPQETPIDMFAFRFLAIGPILAEYRKFHIWPWKFKVRVMTKVKPDGHIWALEFNRYVCFLFRGNRTIFGWDIANSISDLEISRSRSWRKSTKM